MGVPNRLAGSIRLMATVVRVPDLRRLELAFAGFGLAEYATWVAILVYAFGVHGATGAGVAAAVMLAPSTVAAPIASTFGDLIGRRRSLIGGYAIQAIAMGAVAVALASHAPFPAVIALGALAATSVTFTRPAQWSILTSLAETPEQLTAANVMTASIGNATVLAGPAISGALLTASGPALVFAVSAGVLVASALLVARIRTSDPPRTGPRVTHVLRESRAGLARLLEERSSRLVVGLVALRSVAVGAIDVLAVVLALSFLNIGRGGAGYLTAAFGAGALGGAAGAAALATGSALSRPLRGGLAAFGIAIAAIASVRTPWVAFTFLALGGAGHTVAEVAGRTLLQRLTPDAVLSRVFGVLEGLDMAGLAVGSISASLLVDAVGVRWTLVTLGLLLPAAILVTGRRTREIDLAAPVDEERLRLLKSIAMFRPLDPPTIERLASALIPLEMEAGATVVRQGDLGDRVYLVDRGTVAVVKDGQQVATLGPGDFFGEIALLRDVPRTATVTCREACRLYALERDPFLAALSRHSTAAAHAEAVVRDRLLPWPHQKA